MHALKRISPAVAGVGLGLGFVHGLPAHAQGISTGTQNLGISRHLGVFRSGLEGLSKGLSVSLVQDFTYDSNIVRTSGKAETLALYGKTDSSDWVSQTGMNASYLWNSARTEIRFGGGASYAKYFNFDQFSGWVANGNGSIDWHFSDRCSTTVRGLVSRRLSDFQDVFASTAGFQDEYDGSFDVGCFLLERVRVSLGAFGGTLRNEKASQKFLNLDRYGGTASIAYVSARQNEIGFSYRFTRTHRPDDPFTPDYDDHNFSVFGSLHLGNHFLLHASGGYELNQPKGGKEVGRTSASADLQWNMTPRLATRLSYVRTIENAADIVGTTTATDRPRADVTWRLSDNASLGGFVEYDDAHYTSALPSPINGVSEQTTSAGAYLQHTLFHVLNVRWTVAHSTRNSGLALRNYDSTSAGVTLAVAF